MKKNLLIVFIIVFIELSGLIGFKNIIFNKTTEKKYESLDTLRNPTTLFSSDLIKADEIAFDEEYAINTAIYVYNQIYEKEYSSNDFIVEDIDWLGSCWNICLNNTKEQNPDVLKGLVINKNNGGILANLGEFNQ